jgi:hypothetical protein
MKLQRVGVIAAGVLVAIICQHNVLAGQDAGPTPSSMRAIAASALRDSLYVIRD